MDKIVNLMGSCWFKSRAARRLYQLAAVGFLGCFAALGFLPHSQRLFGFSGFFGFFGFVGAAFIAEGIHRRRTAA